MQNAEVIKQQKTILLDRPINHITSCEKCFFKNDADVSC